MQSQPSSFFPSSLCITLWPLSFFILPSTFCTLQSILFITSFTCPILTVTFCSLIVYQTCSAISSKFHSVYLSTQVHVLFYFAFLIYSFKIHKALILLTNLSLISTLNFFSFLQLVSTLLGLFTKILSAIQAMMLLVLFFKITFPQSFIILIFYSLFIILLLSFHSSLSCILLYIFFFYQFRIFFCDILYLVIIFYNQSIQIKLLLP